MGIRCSRASPSDVDFSGLTEEVLAYEAPEQFKEKVAALRIEVERLCDVMVATFREEKYEDVQTILAQKIRIEKKLEWVELVKKKNDAKDALEAGEKEERWRLDADTQATLKAHIA